MHDPKAQVGCRMLRPRKLQTPPAELEEYPWLAVEMSSAGLGMSPGPAVLQVISGAYPVIESWVNQELLGFLLSEVHMTSCDHRLCRVVTEFLGIPTCTVNCRCAMSWLSWFSNLPHGINFHENKSTSC